MGIAQTLERLSECFDKMEGQSTQTAPERKSRPKRPRCPVEFISSSDKEDVQNLPKHKRKTSRKGKSRSTREHGEASNESSSCHALAVVLSPFEDPGPPPMPVEKRKKDREKRFQSLAPKALRDLEQFPEDLWSLGNT
ncbi:UNVERIFIED_CONTAM: hypothetical protein K2H54_073887 [Gekko kuhli]